MGPPVRRCRRDIEPPRARIAVIEAFNCCFRPECRNAQPVEQQRTGARRPDKDLHDALTDIRENAASLAVSEVRCCANACSSIRRKRGNHGSTEANAWIAVEVRPAPKNAPFAAGQEFANLARINQSQGAVPTPPIGGAVDSALARAESVTARSGGHLAKR